MTGTILAASFGAIAGADLESELVSPRPAKVRETIDATSTARRRTTEHELPASVAVELRGVGKRYGDRVVLDGIDLSIARGSFVAIVGRSGCGKSTLLRIVAGLETTSAGTIMKSGERGGTLDTRIMYQDARLLPWKSVLDNVMLGLGRASRDDARGALADVGLLARANDWPMQLSGGQRQRIALARALVHRPQLLLLDEPLGALDALTRIEMHALIERLRVEHRFTALLVTHDVQEAVALGDRIILLERGRVTWDEPVDLVKPRTRVSPRFAQIEDRVLSRLLGDRQATENAPHRCMEAFDLHR
ncbi:ATP-binding cassette domain-containing protein [Trinickia sp. NRRL B-1857]|uniref:ATP-binding cassette domain-containing protein n=1 Tax=Trinickia sp. NRRL B-1857 TaxID=3162879 RepID=UPI003D2E67A5